MLLDMFFFALPNLGTGNFANLLLKCIVAHDIIRIIKWD